MLTRDRKSILAGLTLFTTLLLGACAGARVADPGWEGARLTGRLVDGDGRPMAGSFVYAYHVDRSVMGPAEAMSEETGDDGSYLLVAPPGEYVVVARKRASGSVGGALKNGDFIGRLPEPVRLSASSPARRDLVLHLFSQGREGDPRKVLSTETRVYGRVQDAKGRPVEGAHAFAYLGSFASRPPDFLSAPTDAEGRFSLSLPGGGEYVIGARTGLRGRPQPDDQLGFWHDRREPGVIEAGSVTEDAVVVIDTYGEKGEIPSFPPIEGK